MIISMKNYPTVVDAKAWAVQCDWNDLITESMEFCDKCSNGGDAPSYPSIITNNKNEVVGVTFGDAEDAINQIYGFDWNQCVQYGDLMLIANRKELMDLPDETRIFIHMKNDRGENLVVIFDPKKFMVPDTDRKSHNDSRLMMNYCKVGVSEDHRDDNTLTVISLIKDDENVLESDVLLQIGGSPDGLSFSAPV